MTFGHHHLITIRYCFPGKKCTYGIKCKYHHPERSKQSNHAVADELRENAKHPSTSERQSSALPGESLSLMEDMAKKLTLGHESGSLKSKKDRKSENGTQVKGSHRSSKRSTSRKKTGQEHSSVQYSGSLEQLDSGLGSIDSQPVEAPWGDQMYGVKYDRLQQKHSVREQYCPFRSPPCSCCSHGRSSQGNTTAFSHHHHQYSSGSFSNHGSTPYRPTHYTSYGPYPVEIHTHSQPTDFHQQHCWSIPFGVHPEAFHSLPGESSCWESNHPEQRKSSVAGEEREAVRKKLLAIFSSHFVDKAMNMFPQLMDAEILVTEILKLQSQGRSLR